MTSKGFPHTFVLTAWRPRLELSGSVPAFLAGISLAGIQPCGRRKRKQHGQVGGHAQRKILKANGKTQMSKVRFPRIKSQNTDQKLFSVASLRSGLRLFFLLLVSILFGTTAVALPSADAEGRVVDYIRTHLQPGQPLMVTGLYNRVFTQPDERQALNKLYNAFFRIPLFVADYQERFKSPPSLTVIAEQFDLRSPAEADVLLRVMESDPRVPRFLIRDPKTGEITHVDVQKSRPIRNSVKHHAPDWRLGRHTCRGFDPGAHRRRRSSHRGLPWPGAAP